MTGCLDFVYDSEHDPSNTVQMGGCSADATVHVGESQSDGLYYSLTDYTTMTMIHDPTANAGWGIPVVDSSDKVWWIETPDFSTYRLMRMELDGSSVTTVASLSGFPPTAFEVPAIRYDPVGDRFWFYLNGSSFRGFWTMSKAGVCVRRYTTTDQPGWGPVVADDGGVWGRFNNSGTSAETVIRIDGSTFAATTTSATIFTSRFQVAFANGSGGGVIARDNLTTRLYLPGITNAAADCDVSEVGQPATYSAFGRSYSTPDFSHNFYAVGNGCPFWTLIWDRAGAEPGIPPMRLYFRDDDQSVGSVMQRWSAGSIQQSTRIRQGQGYV